jgi:hypothetical protein
MKTLLALLAGLLLGGILGWGHANLITAEKCERLGGFFHYGDNYRCELVEPKEPNRPDPQTNGANDAPEGDSVLPILPPAGSRTEGQQTLPAGRFRKLKQAV